jgi:hypothetical protein
VGVQRVRLITDFIQKFGWNVVLICVHPKYLEEEKSNDLLKLQNQQLEIHSVNAFNVSKRFRFLGDISLRSFPFLLIKAIQIVKIRRIQIVWIPIPPFYTSLLGRFLQLFFPKLKYGIDYIDPWVHDFPGRTKLFSRAWASYKLSYLLEPIAVKKASFITGISSSYFSSVMDRNPLLRNIPTLSMPYGFNKNDYFLKPKNCKLLWQDNLNVKFPYIYAGAFLPKSIYYFEILFASIQNLYSIGALKEGTHFYFVGTGSTIDNNILSIAKKYQISNLVTEISYRISYLEVIHNLSNSHGVLVIGSIEAHYSASKIFQSILSKRPVFSVFHIQSSVIEILSKLNADSYLVKFIPDLDDTKFKNEFSQTLANYFDQKIVWNPSYDELYQYSAEKSTFALVELLNKIY